jgi:uncharacterized DUF497 family protein
MTTTYSKRPRNANTREVYFLLWDDENERHLAEHGVSVAEARELLGNRHLTKPNPRAEGRITLIGQTNGGRVLAMALDPTSDLGTWRPVTALPPDPDERRLFDRYCR